MSQASFKLDLPNYRTTIFLIQPGILPFTIALLFMRFAYAYIEDVDS